MSDLVNRLRGIYNIPVNDGAGLLDGKDTFTRTFDNLPPIHAEAANRIEALERENAALRELLAEAISDVAYNDLGADQDSLYHRMKLALNSPPTDDTPEPKP